MSMKKMIRWGMGMVLLSMLGLSSCKKEVIYTYEVNDVDVSQPGAAKPNVKSDLEVW